MSKFILTSLFATFSLLAGAAGPAPQLHQNSGNINLPEAVNPSFRIAPPETDSKRQAPEADGEWTPIGEGTYTDILFSDLYGKEAQVLKVNFEQNASDPTLYRIPNVYENMDLSAYNGTLTYDATNATPMVFHVFDNMYAYFDEFDTGIFMTYQTSTNYYDGEIHMLMQGVDLLEYNDIWTLIRYLPECLCTFRDGNITMDATFTLEGNTWSNILGLVWVTGTPYDVLFRGNSKSNFLVTLPEAKEYDPNEDWEDVGMAEYTDAFTEGLYSSNPVYGTWEVLLQKNMYEDGLYRLVNPYKDWKGNVQGVSYDDTSNYYMTLMIQDYDGFSLVGIPTFYTGLTRQGYGALAVSNQAADALKDAKGEFLTLYYNYPGCLGMMEDGVITYSSHCVIDMEYIQNFYAYYGAFSWDAEFISANGKGNFKLVWPKENENAAVIGIESDQTPEYYNLQGVRIYNPAKGQILIEKRGNASKKIIF